MEAETFDEVISSLEGYLRRKKKFGVVVFDEFQQMDNTTSWTFSSKDGFGRISRSRPVGKLKIFKLKQTLDSRFQGQGSVRGTSLKSPAPDKQD